MYVINHQWQILQNKVKLELWTLVGYFIEMMDFFVDDS